MYIYDTEFEMANRLSLMPWLCQDILEFIKLLLNQLNPIVANFRSMFFWYEYNWTLLAYKTDNGLDQHIYNKPTGLQVAVVWVEGNDFINYTKMK